MFGDDALKSLLSAGFEQGGTITIELIAKLNATSLICPKQTLQPGTTLNECLLAEVLAIEVQQIKPIQDDAVGPLSQGRSQCLKIRSAVSVWNNSFTVREEGLRSKAEKIPAEICQRAHRDDSDDTGPDKFELLWLHCAGT